MLSVLHSQVLNHFISGLNLNLIAVNLLDWLSLCFLSEDLKSECQGSAHEAFLAVPPPFPPLFPCCSREAASSLFLALTVCQLYSQPELQVYLFNTDPQINGAFYSCTHYSPAKSNSGWENHRLPCVFECINSENLASLLNENSAMRRNQS